MLGYNPDSRIPSTTRSPSISVHFLTKPKPWIGLAVVGSLGKEPTISVAPHKRAMEARNFRGPSLRLRTVAGGWNTT